VYRLSTLVDIRGCLAMAQWPVLGVVGGQMGPRKTMVGRNDDEMVFEPNPDGAQQGCTR